MPSSYTGDPIAAGIAPDTAGPEPETAPTGELFADGENANAASVSQLVRTLLNHLAWHYKPRARAAAWTKALKRHWSARGHTHYGFDHFGLPAGRCVHWREDLPVSLEAMLTTSLGIHPFGEAPDATVNLTHLLPGWYYTTRKTVVTGDNALDRVVEIVNPTSTAEAAAYGDRYGSRHVRFYVDVTANDTAAIMRRASARFHPDIMAVMEWDALVGNPSLAGVYMAMGFANDFGTNANTIAGGAYFKRLDGETWRCVTRQSGGGATEVDSTVAPLAVGAFQRFRIAFLGSGVDDSAVGRVLFWINDALVANITTNVPTVAEMIVPWFGITTITGGQGPELSIGLPITYSNSLYKITT